MRCDGHQLIQHRKLNLEFKSVSEVLHWICEVDFVNVYEDDNEEIHDDDEDVNENEIAHDPSRTDVESCAEDGEEREDVDAAEDEFEEGKDGLGDAVYDGHPRGPDG